MALPRYLYSIKKSGYEPLLNKNDEGLELAVSAEQEPNAAGPADDSTQGKFDVTVQFSGARRDEKRSKSDVYASARLAAAGIHNPTEEEQLLLLAAEPDEHIVVGSGEGGYGVHGDKPLVTITSPSHNEPGSNGTERLGGGNTILYKNDKSRTIHEEAALYIREGEDNDKFFQHPRGKWSKRAYNILHSTPYHVFHLCVCTLLLLLALMEHPYLGDDALLPQETVTVIIVIHSVFEVVLLGTLWIDMGLRYLWFRPKSFFTHKRTLLILVVLLVMCVEAIVVLARLQAHFRITRALRPVFFIDTYFMHGVRRVLRQIFLCIRPILDVLIMLVLSLVVFSLLGYLIFADLDVTYFLSYSRSLISMLIASTTANHPDVWMEAYSRQPASALFFIVYTIIMVYFISNILLAVVYSSFSEANKNKFRKLFLHKRDALRLAYRVLATSGEGIKFHDFLLFMQQYRPRMPEWQIMCIFKGLLMDPHSTQAELGVSDLSLDKFYGFYEVIDLKWKQVTSEGVELTWFQHYHSVIKSTAGFVYKLVKSRSFNFTISILVLVNLSFLVIYTLLISEEDVGNRFFILNKTVAVSLVFVCIYAVEICLRVIGLGPYNYFKKPRNIIDALIITTSLILLILEAASPSYAVLAVFRPVKFIRLLRLKRRYRDMTNTLYVLSERLISVGILLVIVYYSFAIIGMQFFNNAVFRGCCNTSLYNVEEYYIGDNGTFSVNVYYLLNFDNILRAYVTLFMLMVVNNWYIVMEGFAASSSNNWLVRLYFMTFYLITLVMLQVIISFIVEAFVFNINAKERRRHCQKRPHQHCDCDKVNNEGKKLMAHVSLVKEDIDKLRYEITYGDQVATATFLNKWIRHRRRIDLDSLSDKDSLDYSGQRMPTKDDIHLHMYRSELTLWINQRDKEVEQKEVAKGQGSFWCTMGRSTWTYFKNCLLYIIE